MKSRGSLGNTSKTYIPQSLKNLKEMETFLNTLPTKLKPGDINNLNKIIVSNEIELVIKRLPTEKSTGPDRFTAELVKVCGLPSSQEV